MLEAQRRNIEGDAGIDALLPPLKPLAQYPAQTPVRQVVDKAVLLGEGDEPRGANGAEFGVVPADQRLDLRKAAVAHRHFRLIHHVQGLALERHLQAIDQPPFGLCAH